MSKIAADGLLLAGFSLVIACSVEIHLHRSTMPLGGRPLPAGLHTLAFRRGLTTPSANIFHYSSLQEPTQICPVPRPQPGVLLFTLNKIGGSFLSHPGGGGQKEKRHGIGRPASEGRGLRLSLSLSASRCDRQRHQERCGGTSRISTWNCAHANDRRDFPITAVESH